MRARRLSRGSITAREDGPMVAILVLASDRFASAVSLRGGSWQDLGDRFATAADAARAGADAIEHGLAAARDGGAR
jgi:hypothetical protein